MVQTRTALKVVYAGFCRFVGCALFGGLVSLVIFFVVIFWGLYGFFDSYWKHTLWIVPLVWGILGIFWFDRMLDIARDIFEAPFHE